ncbi:MAG: DMT family transporter [Ruminococcaceae bacterium]|nr:DMT family transporter [Oscillospiraceae bacterium]
MWFWFSIIALVCWSGSDLFSKIGCQHEDDKLSHLKMTMAVGLVMGLHAAWEIFIGGVEISWQIIWTYLPVSLLYIVSMVIGYAGLRYIELSISSPICNASGALVVILALFTAGMNEIAPAQLIATAVVCIGTIGLGVVEAREDDALRAARQEKGNRRYAKSWLALGLPVMYALLDAAGTYADARVLETLNEDSANVAYELTFLAAGLVCFVYVVLIRRSRLIPRREGPKYLGAVCETAGQLAYIYALADTAHVALSVSIIGAYCVVSVLWSWLFLKERLSWKHYLMIGLVAAGIVVLGVYDA